MEGRVAGVESLLPPELQRKLAGFRFDVGAHMEGSFLGLHRSAAAGSSLEFSKHREYNPGDDIRRVNWQLFGRSDRFYVKEYSKDAGADVLLLVDGSASMRLPDSDAKLLYSVRLAAALAWVLLHQGDNVGAKVEDAQGVLAYLRPNRDPTHFLRIAEVLEAAGQEPGDAPFSGGADEHLRGMLVMIISDFLVPLEELRRRLSVLARGKNRVLMFHVIHPYEYRPEVRGDVVDWSRPHKDSFPFRDACRFLCPETGRYTVLDGRTMREEYLRRFHDFMTDLRQLAAEHYVSYMPLSTAEDFESFLFRLLRRWRHA